MVIMILIIHSVLSNEFEYIHSHAVKKSADHANFSSSYILCGHDIDSAMVK